MSSHFINFKTRLGNPFTFRMFLLKNVPAAFFAGLHLQKLQAKEASVSLNYSWINKNPFRSVYFAVLSMAAETSTGILCMGYLYKRNPSVSMLLISQKGNFFKKATGKIIFTCADGDLISEAAGKAETSGKATTIICQSIGVNEQQQTVAEFFFTWSFKARVAK